VTLPMNHTTAPRTEQNGLTHLMLSINKYPQEFIDDCRQRIDVQVAAYRGVAAAAGGAKQPALAAAIESFEPHFFNNMVLVLDQLFVHRSRMIEGKDGNPMNEVRVLCNSLLQNGGLMLADKGIKLKADQSILQYKVGDQVRLNDADFARLADAYFAAIEQTFA
jgi:hypothetical protein